MKTNANRTVQKAAVLGAGVMGSGIAALLAAAGVQVLLLDIVPRALSEEEAVKGLTTESSAFRNRLANAGLKKIEDKRAGLLYTKEHLNRIEVGNLTDDFDKLGTCDWIIEVVVERLDVKQALMERIEEVCRPGAIVSTNTSGVSVNAIVQGRSEEFKRHFLGTHFFNPPRYMHLFEMIPGEMTDPDILAFMSDFASERLGKGVVPAKDTPNFIGNRIGTYATLLPVQLAEKYGYSLPLVDQLTGAVLGRPKSATFRTLDMVGLDIFLHVAQNVVDNVSDPEECECFAIPAYVTELVKGGALGDKTRKGFYMRTKVDGKKAVLTWDREQKDYISYTAAIPESVAEALKSKNKYQTMVSGESEENRFAWECIKGILLYSAARVPEIADDFRLIDKAMMWGYNWEKGPFAIWDAIGLRSSVERMRAEGEIIPQWVEELLQSGAERFYDSDTEETPHIRIASPKVPVLEENSGAKIRDLGDGVLGLEFTTKGNTIDLDMVEMINCSVDLLETGSWQGLVIGNNGKGFCTGANLNLIGEVAESGNWDELGSIVEKLQGAVMRLKYAPRPVVSAPFGMTLGGGMEIVLHSSGVCAHSETYMGLVEAGVGLVPGAGGSKELLIRAVGSCSATDKVSMLPAVKKAWKNVATAAVSSNGFDAVQKNYLRKENSIVMNQGMLIERAKEKVLRMAGDHYTPPAKTRIPVLGEFGRASILFDLHVMLDGGFVSAHDAVIGEKLAYIFTGGGVPAGMMVAEEYILELEKEAFVSLCGEEKTRERIAHMLSTGKPLRN